MATNKSNYEKKQSNFFPNLLVNDKIIEDDEEKAKIFGEKLYKTFNQQSEDINNFSKKHKEYVDNFINNNLYHESYEDKNIEPITMAELEYAIKKSKKTNCERSPSFLI